MKITQITQPDCALYPATDWPYTLYFNAEPLPKWSGCWPPKLLNKYLTEDSGADVSDRDVQLLSHRIDHIGIPESAPPAVFLFAVQRVLLLLLEHPDEARAAVSGFQDSPNPDEVWEGVFEGGMRMREFVIRDRLALWTSGYEDERVKTKAIMDAFGSPPEPRPLLPHQHNVAYMLAVEIRRQVKQFHQLAQSGNYEKPMRERLHRIAAPDESFLQLVT